MAEKSQLQETVDQKLLDERTVFTVEIRDAVTGQVESTSLTTENPCSLNMSEFLPSGYKFHIEDALDLFEDIITNAQVMEGIEEDKRISLQVEFNNDFMQNQKERIVYNVLKREPGNMSKDGRSRPNRGFSHAYDFIPADNPNHVVIVETRPIDHRIQFTAWATTARACESRSLWLERLFIAEAWRLRKKGAQIFHWVETKNTTITEPSGNKLYGKHLIFKLRLREHFVISHPSIQNFEFTISK